MLRCLSYLCGKAILLRQADCGYSTFPSCISSGIGFEKIKFLGIHFLLLEIGSRASHT